MPDETRDSKTSGNIDGANTPDRAPAPPTAAAPDAKGASRQARAEPGAPEHAGGPPEMDPQADTLRAHGDALGDAGSSSR